MNTKRVEQRTLSPDTPILKALKLMDELGVKSLIVLKQNKFIGILSIGDIQRAIIRNQPLNDTIAGILRLNPRIGHTGITLDEAKDLMLRYKMELLPVVNEANEISSCFFWEDLFPKCQVKPIQGFNLPVVIMAGGFGNRLKPLTNVIPKPLIPIGEKTMLEEIFSRFALYGCNSFYISVNYKAELIEYYIGELNLPYSISYLKEEKPLGTAGSLHLLNDKINSTFFVTNCDIIIEQDYSELLEFHRENNNEITIVAALKHYPIPYGIIETGANGNLKALVEKPELTFKINSGMYILEPHVIPKIPKNKFYHITQLIHDVMQNGGKVGVFPVSEKSWKDVGDWKEYIGNVDY
jgi:dTDP-glucose pyrophosphorylase